MELSGFSRREVFFSKPPVLKDRDILIIASMLHTGVTMDFLCKRLQENRPRSLRIAVLIDRPADRRVDLQPDYFGFLGASNRFVGYGLAGPHEHFRNLPFVGVIGGKKPAGSGRKEVRSCVQDGPSQARKVVNSSSAAKTILIWMVFILLALVVWRVFTPSSQAAKVTEISYSELMAQASSGNIKEITIDISAEQLRRRRRIPRYRPAFPCHDFQGSGAGSCEGFER